MYTNVAHKYGEGVERRFTRGILLLLKSQMDKGELRLTVNTKALYSTTLNPPPPHPSTGLLRFMEGIGKSLSKDAGVVGGKERKGNGEWRITIRVKDLRGWGLKGKTPRRRD